MRSERIVSTASGAHSSDSTPIESVNLKKRSTTGSRLLIAKAPEVIRVPHKRLNFVHAPGIGAFLSLSLDKRDLGARKRVNETKVSNVPRSS